MSIANITLHDYETAQRAMAHESSTTGVIVHAIITLLVSAALIIINITYHLLEGRLWPLAVVGIAATPLAARGWRLRIRRRIDAGSGIERLSTTTSESGRPR